jgi:hypothetical protein
VTAPAVAQVFPIELVPEAQRARVLERARFEHPEAFAVALTQPSRVGEMRELCSLAWAELQAETRPKRKRRRHRR